jgi:hypothetical protein
MQSLSTANANENNPFSPLPHCGIHDNGHCFDCGESDPEWVSLGFGTFVCLDCAGHHRSIGVHITMVRASKLDVWNSVSVPNALTVPGFAILSSLFLSHSL